MERMSGADAIFLHLEKPDTPLHTLKIAVLDASERGQEITLGELHSAVSTRLGLVPRATQRVVKAPGFGGRPFWIDDSDFDLDHHLDERTLEPPGGPVQLDALYSELATATLDRRRPLWSMTLVHGLARRGGTADPSGRPAARGVGRQAVVVRVHHAVTDGLGAMNILLACTTPSRSQPVSELRREPPVSVRRWDLARLAIGDVGPWLRGLGGVARDGVRSWRRSRAFRKRAPDLPPFIGSHRNFCNARSGPG